MADSDSQWRLFGALLRPHRRATAVYAVALLAATAMPIGAALLLAEFVRRAVDRAPTSRLVPLAAAYALSGILSAALTLGVSWRATILAWRVTDTLRHDLARFVLHADLAFHRDRTPGELVTRVDADVTAMTDFLSAVVSRVIAIAALAVCAVLVLLVVEPVLAPALGAGVILIGWTTWKSRDWATSATASERAAEADLIGVAEQYLSGAEDIAALGAANHGIGRFAHRAARHVEATGRRVAKQMKTQQAIRISIALSGVGMIVWGALALSWGWVDVAAVVLGFRFVAAVQTPTEQLTWRLQEAQGASGSARRVLELLQEGRSLTTGDERLPLGAIDVRFEAVELVYDDATEMEAAVDGITLTLPAGRSLGVIGRSGSGKTSMARMLLRLVAPTGGRLLVGGVEIGSVREDDLRSRITAVPQDVQLFPGSVYDNVTLFGDRRLDEVRSALVDVGLGPWLDGLPDGLSTVLRGDQRDGGGSGGVGLSAGEAQLLSVARAIVRRPDVVVLDEATSRVDPETQAAIATAMGALVKGRTAMIIAHRLETLDSCDDIAVLAEGRLVEHGPRDVLAADPLSHYARLRALGNGSEELA